MIGWENNQGAYFIQKLNAELDSVESDVSDVTTASGTNASNIGKMSDLTTTANDTLVKAVNEVDSHADTNASNIGTMSSLTIQGVTNLVGALNNLNARSLITTYWNGSDYDIDTLNSYDHKGFYNIGANVVHAPEAWTTLFVIAGFGGGTVVQVCFGASTIYWRLYTGSPLAWSAWKKVTGTSV